MGWSYTPYVAQSVSNHIVRGLGVAWIDDFILLGRNRDEFESRRKELWNRLDRYKVEVDLPSLPPTQRWAWSLTWPNVIA